MLWLGRGQAKNVGLFDDLEDTLGISGVPMKLQGNTAHMSGKIRRAVNVLTNELFGDLVISQE